MRGFPLPLLLALTACSTLSRPGAVIDGALRDWRLAVTADDRNRLRDWRDAFVEGLREARAAGHGAEIGAQGTLLNPDAAQGGGPIPNGTYRCRMIKLGAK